MFLIKFFSLLVASIVITLLCAYLGVGAVATVGAGLWGKAFSATLVSTFTPEAPFGMVFWSAISVLVLLSFYGQSPFTIVRKIRALAAPKPSEP